MGGANNLLSLGLGCRDRVGSPDLVTDANGNVVSRASFDAFGRSRRVTSLIFNTAQAATCCAQCLAWWCPLPQTRDRNATTWLPNGPSQQTSDLSVDVEGFANEMQFADLGLVFVGARMYDPALGRLLAADPVGFGCPFMWKLAFQTIPQRGVACDCVIQGPAECSLGFNDVV